MLTVDCSRKQKLQLNQLEKEVQLRAEGEGQVCQRRVQLVIEEEEEIQFQMTAER